MSRNNKTSRAPNRRNILSGIISMLLGMPLATLAGPEGEHVIHGNVDISRPDAASTLVRQHTQNALLDWQSFNIDADELVAFQQPGSESIAVNRVIGGSPTEILGQLQANGQVFILNTQGVYFAPTAQLDVHGLVAAAGTISSTDFLTGKYRISNITGNVTNAGNIQANSGGYIMLAGERIENTGTLNVSNGDIGLAAGRQVTVNVAGDELIGFTIDEAALGNAAGIHNAGDIIGDGGMVVMEARTAGDLASAAINQQGRVRANSTSIENGRIMLRARGGDIRVSGELDADGVNGNDGGRMQVHSDRNITVTGNARLHADGKSGGTVRAIAEETLDLQSGSELGTRNLSAAGNGGFIEASGHGTFHLDGDIRTGQAGTFLIDPADVTIVPGTAGTGTDIGADYIEGLLAGGTNVMIVASNSVSVNETIETIAGTGNLHLAIGTVTAGSCGTEPVCTGFPVLTPVADGTITVSAGAPIIIRGNITLTAQDGTIVLEDSIDSFAGSVTLNAGAPATGAQYDGVINTGAATQSDIDISAYNDITIMGGTLVELGTLGSTSGGDINITVDGDLWANRGELDLDSGAAANAIATVGSITISTTGGTDGGDININGDVSAYQTVSITAAANAGANITMDAVNSTNDDVLISAASDGNGASINLSGDVTAGGNVQLDANSESNYGADITLSDGAGTNYDITAGGNIQVTANSDFEGNIIAGDITSTSAAGTVEIGTLANAISGDLDIGSISNANGSIRLNSLGNISTGSITAGNVVRINTNTDATSGGNITIAGDITNSGSDVIIQAESTGNGANVTIADESDNVFDIQAGRHIQIQAEASGTGGDVMAGNLTAQTGRVYVMNVNGAAFDPITGSLAVGDVAADTEIILKSSRDIETGSLASNNQNIQLATNAFETDEGNITVNGNVSSANASIHIDTVSFAGNGGNVVVNGNMTAGNGSILIDAASLDDGANIAINGSMSAGTHVEMSSLATNNGGGINTGNITTDNGNVFIVSSNDSTVPVSGSINTGDIDSGRALLLRSAGDITTGSLSGVSNGFTLQAISEKAGQGNVTVNGDIVSGGGVRIEAANNTGDGGTIRVVDSAVTAQNHILLYASSAGTGADIVADTLTSNNGNIDVRAAATGNGGNVTLGDLTSTTGQVFITNRDGATFLPVSGSISIGQIDADAGVYLHSAGDIQSGSISSNRNGVIAKAIGDENGEGNILINGGIDSGSSFVSLFTENSAGDGGNITLRSGILSDSANVTVSASSAGDGANITMETLSGLRTGITAGNDVKISANAAGTGGNLELGNIVTEGGDVFMANYSGGVPALPITGSISVGTIVSGRALVLRSAGNVTTGNLVSSDFLYLDAGGNLLVDGSLDAGGVNLSAGGSAVLAGPVSVNGTATSSLASVPDADLDSLLASVGMPSVSGAPSAAFSAESLTFGDVVTLGGDYLYFSSDSLGFDGDVTLGNPDAVVQVTPHTDGASFGLEATADTAAGLTSKTSSNADVGYTWEGMLEHFADATLVLGHSMASSDAFLGLDGAIDIAGSNLLLLTSGTLTGIGNIISTGIVAAPLSILASEPEETAVPAESIFEAPLLDEIDDESDEEENRLAESGTTPDKSDESDGASVTHRTAPESLECSI